MNLLEVISLANGKVKGAAEIQWQCFGEDAYYMDIGSEEQGQIASAIYDSDDGSVYVLELFNVAARRAWRWIDPRYADLFLEECREQRTNPNIAYDTVLFTSVSDSQALQLLSSLAGTPEPVDQEQEDDTA
jgi:hypothetical protein